MVTILRALRQIREDLAGLLQRTTVVQVCRALGYTWQERQLDPYTTLHLFILQVVNRNTAMTHLPHLAATVQTRHDRAGTRRESHPPWPRRTPLPQTPPETVPTDERTPRRTTQTPEKTKRRSLT